MRILKILVLLLLASLPAGAGTVVQFRTAIGDLKIELYDEEKPITVTNFLRYLTSGTYRDGFFHRAVHDFVVQGGGYAVTGKGTTNASVVVLPNLGPITNEFAVGPFLPNVAGTIAMAKNSNPNSATSEFFFNLTNNPHLDNLTNSGGFTVFGRVVSGFQTLTNWNSFQPIAPPATNLIIAVSGSSIFTSLPIYQLSKDPASGGYYIALKDLFYVDITLLDVAVARRPDGTAEIRWSPVANRTNTVEFTTEFPPQWQVLSNVPPANVTQGIVIDPTVDPRRFYRVRATY